MCLLEGMQLVFKYAIYQLAKRVMMRIPSCSVIAAKLAAGGRTSVWNLTLCTYLSIGLLWAGSAAFGSGTWPGWRGGEFEGHAQSPVNPVCWNGESNRVWKTILPGEGFSSPVVSADSVYLTAVTKDGDSPVSGPILRMAEYLLVLVAIGLGLYVAIGFASREAMQWRALVRTWSLGGFCALLGITAGCVLFGESVAHFEAFSRESRLALSCVFSAGCFVCSMVPGFGVRTRLSNLSVGGIFMSAGLGLIVVVVAGRARAALQPWRMPLMVAAALGSLAVSVVHFGWAWANGKRSASQVALSGGAVGVIDGYGSRWLGRGSRILAALLASVACGVVIRMFARTQGLANLTFDSYTPVVPSWPLAVALCLILVAVALRRRRNSSALLERIIMLSCLVGAPIALAVSFEYALGHVRYLRHILLTRQPTWEGILGWPGVCACLACWVCVMAYGSVRSSKQPWAPGLGLSLFRGTALSLGILSLAHWSGVFQPRQGTARNLSVVAVDRDHGRVSWVASCAQAPAEFSRLNSRATPTPVIWSNRICAYFGSQGLVCLDATGRRLWTCTELPFKSDYGVATSPVLCEGRIVIDSEPSTSGPGATLAGSIAAVDCENGKVLWRKPRPKIQNNLGGNNRTPTVLSIGGTKVVVVWGGEDVTAYEPRTGNEVWSYRVPGAGSGADLVASAIADEATLYLPFQGWIVAVKLSRLGSSQDPLLWKARCPGLNCVSPVVANGLLFAISDQGLLWCVDADTGTIVWKRQLKGTHYCSPIIAGNYVCVCNTEGRSTVLRCDRSAEIVAVNELNDRVVASFAPVDGRFYIRTQKHLYCIGR